MSIAFVAPKPRIPVPLANVPFNLEQARSQRLTKDQLRGRSETPAALLSAARLRLPDGAVFCRATAGWLHGLDTPACNPIEVTVHVDCYITRIAGVVIHRSKELEKSFAEGLPVTSPVRTVADLGCSLPLVDAVVIIDAALHRRLVKVNQLTSWVADHKGHRGVRRLRRAIELAEPATESPMETRLRLLLVLAGLPKPMVQVPLYDRTQPPAEPSPRRRVPPPAFHRRRRAVGSGFGGGSGLARSRPRNRAFTAIPRSGHTIAEMPAPLIIEAAINGATTKSRNPNIPGTVEEIVASASAAAEGSGRD